MEELLTCLTTEELQEVTDDIQNIEQEFVHFSSKTAIPVKEHYLRYAMHQMNMLSGKTEYPPTLVNLQDDVSILRKHFIPTHTFENAVILRGTFLPLRTTYGNKRGALLLWKKRDVSQMYVLDTHSLDLRSLKPNQWTCVFLWNSDGKMPDNPDVPQPQQNIQPPPGLPPVDGQPPVDPHNDIPMDPDENMPGPPLVPDDDPQDNPPDGDEPPEEPMDPPTYPPGFPPDDTHPPDPHTGLPPPEDPTPSPQFPHPGPHPPGPPPSGSQVPPTQPPHQPLPHFSPPTTLPLQPLPGNAFIPSLVVPPNIQDTQMHHSIKRETHVPASSPQKKAKAPAPGNQMIAPSGLSVSQPFGG